MLAIVEAMPISNQEQLLTFFNQKNFVNAVNYAIDKDITPISDPQCANIVAASLFQLSNYSDCILWCEGLSPSFEGDPAFCSMYGAALRRSNRLDEASSVFEKGLKDNPKNPPLLNNYANLLIDLQQYQRAKVILSDLLAGNPEYEDAKINLERVEFYLSSQSTDPVPTSDISPSQSKLSVLDDPLAFAFTDEEVAQAGGLPISVAPSPNAPRSDFEDLSLDNIATRSNDKELAEFVQLIRSTSTHDFKQAITDLTSLHKKYGSKPFLYELAVEVYIKSSLFEFAEKNALIALQLGSTSPSLYLNLANLAFMRGDQILAVTWLEYVQTHFPDFDQLQPVKTQLMNNGIPTTSTNPFPTE